MTDPHPDLSAALRDAYTVDRQAGIGGMATVYLAHDRKHHRPVALKVLRPELAASVGAERFLREIEVAARLQHPHIVPVYDSGAAAGLLYYVMPFIEGETLRARIDRGGAFEPAVAVRLGSEIASALAYAHEHGVVHRDVKPENILLSGGHAVVADFGIARALAPDSDSLTALGVAVGTPAYMSPEQATASDVGPASDQYSLACVVYEMLAGKPAFSGPTAQAVMTQSVAGPRPHLRTIRKEVPEELDRVLFRAMSQDPTRRYPSVAAFGEALAKSLEVTGRPRPKLLAAVLGVAALAIGLALWAWRGRGEAAASPVRGGAEVIAVVPFSVSGTSDDFLGEGMVDLLSTNLDAVGGIRAADPRTVLNRWRRRSRDGGTDLQDALAVGRDVNAGAVLTGSVVQAGGSVRLNALLYSVQGRELARAQVNGPADSLLPLTDLLSTTLLRDIWRSEQPLPALRVGAITTRSPEAIRHYLQGEQDYRRSNWNKAITSFTRAVEIDSTFALAHLRLASTYGWTGGYGGDAAQRAIEGALRHSDRLTPRDRGLVVGWKLFQQGSAMALDSAERFTAAYPDDPDGWYLLGEIRYHSRGTVPRSQSALTAAFDRAIALDSSLIPAAIHPVHISAAYRDSAAFARYLRVIEAQGDSAVEESYMLARDAVWASPGEVAPSLLSLLRSTGDLSNGTLAGMLRREPLPDQVVPPPPSGGNNFQRFAYHAVRSTAFAAAGRLRDARRSADSVLVDTTGLRFARNQWSGLLLTPVLAGLAPPEYAADAVQALRARGSGPDVIGWYLRALLALRSGKIEEARRAADAGLKASDTSLVRPLLAAARARVDIAQGDTAGGLARLRANLQQLALFDPGLTAPLRFDLALMLASRPDTRNEGIDRLRHNFVTDHHYLGLVYHALGKAYEDAGDKAAALQVYGDFVRLWANADPELKPRVEDARRAMRELTEERT